MEKYKRVICAGINERDKTHNNKFCNFFLSLQVKHGFEAHSILLWHYRFEESRRDFLGTAVH